MRYLLISIILVAFSSCASYVKKNGLTETNAKDDSVINPYFTDIEKDYVYKAKIKVYKKNFGGILVVKKIAPEEHRIVFTTEMGSKILDFSFKKDTFKVNYILDEMNKKLLINILKRDFRVLITEKLSVFNQFAQNDSKVFKTEIENKTYYLFKEKELLKRMIRVGQGKEKVGFYFSKINDNIARSIQIKHQNIQLTINLNSIN